MDKIIELAMQINLGNLIVIGAMLWFLYARIEKKLDKMQETITDIDRRLCRLEGAFNAKECCILTNQESKKVQ